MPDPSTSSCSSTYNKAHEVLPSTALYPLVQQIAGTKVFISLPTPDKLHIKGALLPHHVSKNTSLAHSEIGPWLMGKLASGAAGPVNHTKFPGQKVYTEVQVEFGAEKRPVFFKLAYAPAASGLKKDSHTLELQCNPTKLGQEGLFELLYQLEKVTHGKFIVGAFLADARVTRIDVAVDVVGLQLPDLWVNVKGSAKRFLCIAPPGQLQSYSIHRVQKVNGAGELSTKAKRKPAGDLLARVYDKRAQRIANGENPKFGDTPECRIEIERLRFSKKSFGLLDLADWSNPLSRLRARVNPLAPLSKGARTYLGLRRTLDHDTAANMAGLSKPVADKCRTLVDFEVSGLFSPAKLWELWPSTLYLTGLIYLVEAAQQKTSGVPLPDEAA